MSTNTLIPLAAPPAPAVPSAPTRGAIDGQRIFLTDISWQNYVALGEIFDERHIRLTYDRGNLEIMTLSREHERINELLGPFSRSIGPGNADISRDGRLDDFST